MRFLLIAGLNNGSGKSTLAQTLKDHQKIPYDVYGDTQLFRSLTKLARIEVDHFARALKEDVITRFFNYPIFNREEAIQLMDQHKSTPLTQAPLTLRSDLVTLLGLLDLPLCAAKLEELKVSQIQTYRDLLIFWGQYIKRVKGQDYWARAVIDKYRHRTDLDLVIIGDFRFQEEYQAFQDRGQEVYTLEILRLAPTQNSTIDFTETGRFIRQLNHHFYLRDPLLDLRMLYEEILIQCPNSSKSFTSSEEVRDSPNIPHWIRREIKEKYQELQSYDFRPLRYSSDSSLSN